LAAARAMKVSSVLTKLENLVDQNKVLKDKASFVELQKTCRKHGFSCSRNEKKEILAVVSRISSPWQLRKLLFSDVRQILLSWIGNEIERKLHDELSSQILRTELKFLRNAFENVRALTDCRKMMREMCAYIKPTCKYSHDETVQVLGFELHRDLVAKINEQCKLIELKLRDVKPFDKRLQNLLDNRGMVAGIYKVQALLHIMRTDCDLQQLSHRAKICKLIVKNLHGDSLLLWARRGGLQIMICWARQSVERKKAKLGEKVDRDILMFVYHMVRNLRLAMTHEHSELLEKQVGGLERIVKGFDNCVPPQKAENVDIDGEGDDDIEILERKTDSELSHMRLVEAIKAGELINLTRDLEDNGNGAAENSNGDENPSENSGDGSLVQPVAEEMEEDVETILDSKGSETKVSELDKRERGWKDLSELGMEMPACIEPEVQGLNITTLPLNHNDVSQAKDNDGHPLSKAPEIKKDGMLLGADNEKKSGSVASNGGSREGNGDDLFGWLVPTVVMPGEPPKRSMAKPIQIPASKPTPTPTPTPTPMNDPNLSHEVSSSDDNAIAKALMEWRNERAASTSNIMNKTASKKRPKMKRFSSVNTPTSSSKKTKRPSVSKKVRRQNERILQMHGNNIYEFDGKALKRTTLSSDDDESESSDGKGELPLSALCEKETTTKRKSTKKRQHAPAEIFSMPQLEPAVGLKFKKKFAGYGIYSGEIIGRILGDASNIIKWRVQFKEDNSHFTWTDTQMRKELINWAIRISKDFGVHGKDKDVMSAIAAARRKMNAVGKHRTGEVIVVSDLNTGIPLQNSQVPSPRTADQPSSSPYSLKAPPMRQLITALWLMLQDEKMTKRSFREIRWNLEERTGCKKDSLKDEKPRIRKVAIEIARYLNENKNKSRGGQGKTLIRVVPPQIMNKFLSEDNNGSAGGIPNTGNRPTSNRKFSAGTADEPVLIESSDAGNSASDQSGKPALRLKIPKPSSDSKGKKRRLSSIRTNAKRSACAAAAKQEDSSQRQKEGYGWVGRKVLRIFKDEGAAEGEIQARRPAGRPPGMNSSWKVYYPCDQYIEYLNDVEVLEGLHLYYKKYASKNDFTKITPEHPFLWEKVELDNKIGTIVRWENIGPDPSATQEDLSRFHIRFEGKLVSSVQKNLDQVVYGLNTVRMVKGRRVSVYYEGIWYPGTLRVVKRSSRKSGVNYEVLCDCDTKKNISTVVTRRDIDLLRYPNDAA